MLPEIINHNQRIGHEIFCPYMLSSVLFARCPYYLAARSFVALARWLRLQATMNDVSCEVWGALQKPKEVKGRSQRLMKLAEHMQQFLVPEIKKRIIGNACAGRVER